MNINRLKIKFSGFTIQEILVVLVISSIIVSFVYFILLFTFNRSELFSKQMNTLVNQKIIYSEIHTAFSNDELIFRNNDSIFFGDKVNLLLTFDNDHIVYHKKGKSIVVNKPVSIVSRFYNKEINEGIIDEIHISFFNKFDTLKMIFYKTYPIDKLKEINNHANYIPYEY
jgi:prepilin-type N-terminal cleavage/methylation domain-containing protein